MIGALARRLFGSANERLLSKYGKTAERINALEADFEKLSDDELRAKTDEFRGRLTDGQSLDDLLPEAFAVVREAAKRTLGQRHYDVQLLGGMVLHNGSISEMKTGEGKTLVATLPVYLNAIEGKGVHVVTVNDYLARRDAEWMGQVYQALGLTTGCIVPGLEDAERREQYAADVTYGTNNEFGFDYLRDNMKFSLASMVQRDFNFAIVDEVDSILIDEARTPLIISGPAEDSSEPIAATRSDPSAQRRRFRERREAARGLPDRQRCRACRAATDRSRPDHRRRPLRHRERQHGAPRQPGLRAHKLFTARHATTSSKTRRSSSSTSLPAA